MNVLGIETSCDETAVAVVQDGRRILSSVVASQMAEHARFGGVVPEVASRRHVEAINTVVRAALSDAAITTREIDLVAVTNRPGLLGALLVGVSAAKAMALALNVPLVGIHHIEAHLYANFLTHPDADFPAVALVVSGGHTDLFHLRGHGEYRLLGRTRDDAAGEAFDKCARLMGLSYPGGPAIQEAAEGGDPKAVKLPRAYLPDTYEFSFSGLKTAVRNVLHGTTNKVTGHRLQGTGTGGRSTVDREDAPPAISPPYLASPATSMAPAPSIPDLAASFQEAVVDVLVRKTVAAAQDTGVERVFLAGGVAANARLRERMEVACGTAGLRLFYPPPALCTDNGAMIAAAGFFYHESGRGQSDLALTAVPSEPLAFVSS
ncbi:MAG: tRNA (adenosine(37)-N6)-threonylcarbamoyltransferase complex transferase subunit TsaD [Akkermansiaceae bacterium]|nr:tRNA (adenosine(37)-N6)-threonylcarbamoyltransferase complex transferase subunit TsaD [Armatimonadota bacterium]